MSEAEIGSYRDADGARHTLVVRQTVEGDWQVLDTDVDADTAHVVDVLADGQDGRPQAAAIARDYLTTVGGVALGAGPAAREPIPEQGGSDARSYRRPRPAPRQHRARDAALPRAAR
jgi:hypothetical protein